MIEFTRTGRKIEWYAKEESPYPYVYWKELQESGWCLSDDGFVVYGKVTPVEEVRGSSIRVRMRVKFDYGTRYTHGRSKYIFEEALAAKGTGCASRSWVDGILTYEPGMMEVFARLVIAGKLPMSDRYRYTRDEYLCFYAVSKYFFNTENQWRAVRTIFNHDRIRTMIQKKIDENLIKNGIDVEKVFDLIKSAEEMGRKHVDKMGNVGNPNILLSVADRYAGLIGMNGKKQLGQGDHPETPGELAGAEHTYDNILKESIPEAVVVEETKS